MSISHQVHDDFERARRKAFWRHLATRLLRRDEVARVITRGIDRGDLRADADIDVATELLVGPVYFRLMFGGELSQAFAERVVDSVLRGYTAVGQPKRTPPPRPRAVTARRLRH